MVAHLEGTSPRTRRPTRLCRASPIRVLAIRRSDLRRSRARMGRETPVARMRIFRDISRVEVHYLRQTRNGIVPGFNLGGAP